LRQRRCRLFLATAIARNEPAAAPARLGSLALIRRFRLRGPGLGCSLIAQQQLVRAVAIGFLADRSEIERVVIIPIVGRGAVFAVGTRKRRIGRSLRSARPIEIVLVVVAQPGEGIDNAINIIVRIAIVRTALARLVSDGECATEAARVRTGRLDTLQVNRE